ncbi:uncharacterized protein LOC122033519 isoform X1 [Zingiber officinale]|uniref:uncharacterized protein LOC122033519 isoform X1 n=1 Tax=Zingiber officinale TaxID=94328 RepID=UPI001C4B3072|nr:uncharacterized protein LOC122033519 isoform X1 [Zingiber officinale]
MIFLTGWIASLTGWIADHSSYCYVRHFSGGFLVDHPIYDSMCRLLSTRTSVSLYGMLVVRIRYIQSTYAIFGEGLYEGLDWLSNNIASKVFGVEGLHLADSAPDGFLFDVE